MRTPEAMASLIRTVVTVWSVYVATPSVAPHADIKSDDAPPARGQVSRQRDERCRRYHTDFGLGNCAVTEDVEKDPVESFTGGVGEDPAASFAEGIRKDSKASFMGGIANNYAAHFPAQTGWRRVQVSLSCSSSSLCSRPKARKDEARGEEEHRNDLRLISALSRPEHGCGFACSPCFLSGGIGLGLLG